MRNAEPAISDGFTFTRAPFSSRYRLKPRLCFSPPVCQLTTVSAPTRSAEKDLSKTAVGNVVTVFTVDETVSTKAGTPVSVKVAVFVTLAGAPVVTVTVMTEPAPTGKAV